MPASAPSKPSVGVAVGLLVCAALILFGTLTRSWFSASRGDASMGIGLMGNYFCDGSECKGEWFNTKTSGDADVHVFRFGAFAAGLGTAVVAGLLGAVALGGRRMSALALYIVGGIALVLALAYIGKLGEAFKGSNAPSVGYSAAAMMIGTLAAIITAAVGLRRRAPAYGYAGPAGYGPAPGYGAAPRYGAAPGYGPGPGAPPGYGAAPGPAMCPRCQIPAQFVPQYQRSYCGRCQQYV